MVIIESKQNNNVLWDIPLGANKDEDKNIPTLKNINGKWHNSPKPNQARADRIYISIVLQPITFDAFKNHKT